MRIARTMQRVGYALYAMAGVLRLIQGGDAAPPAWIAAYALLGLAFHAGARAPLEARRRRLAALAVMVPATFAMAAIRPCPYGALALVLVASQAALVLAPGIVAAWVAAQSVVVGACVISALGAVIGAAEMIALVGFQAFAVAAIATARREAEVRAALARGAERTRIARDLHDILGHSLTALGLQLEIAGHVDPETARVHTAKARELASRLLDDVRSAVATMRPERPLALAAAIRAIVVDAPGLAFHLDAPDSLVVDDRRSECVVRCVQEIVTNARRHGHGASNLWVRLRRDDGDLVVEAHDDGAPRAAIRDGHGLRGMRARFEEMGGELAIRTAPGFSLTARLPAGGAP